MTSRSNPILSVDQLDSRRPIHLAGVAGSAMSGLALLLRQRGFSVVGTDPRADLFRARLEAAGVEVYEEQDGSRIPDTAGLVVATAAIPPDHPELRTAEERQIPVMTYPEFLGALMADGDGVAIAGTHGKTTTTAMIVTVLRSSGIDPSFVIGGVVRGLDSSAAAGDSPLFVCEACEYDRSFLELHPRLAVITNIEEDHLDVYDGLDDILAAFETFASRLPPEGALIYSADCPNTRRMVDAVGARRTSFGIDAEANWTAGRITNVDGATEFDLVFCDEAVGRVRLELAGRHNVANALAAAAVCHELGVAVPRIAAGLARFAGVDRRFEVRGEAAGITVVDDYAHHPTEISALLEGARSRFPGRRLVVLFQPHQFSRTRLMLDRFSEAFEGAGLVLVPDIYGARDSEKERRSVSSRELASRIAGTGVEARYAGSLDAAAYLLTGVLVEGDVLLAAGAGDVNRIIDDLLDRLPARG